MHKFFRCRTDTTMPFSLLWLVVAFLAASPSVGWGETIELNEAVLEVAAEIPDGGGYLSREYREADETKHVPGVPVDVVVNGVKVYEAVPDGSYCCGFTIAVAIMAMDRAGVLPDGLLANRKVALQRAWFIVVEASFEKGCVYAIEQFGLGAEVGHDEATPGDFAQFWRVESGFSDGHSVVFLEWITRGTQTVGFRYRSSQAAHTNGVGDRVAIFRDVDDAIVEEFTRCDRCYRDRTYFGRLRGGQ